MSEHTTEPWGLAGSPDSALELQGGSHVLARFPITNPNRWADAHLMVAAPKLLAALEVFGHEGNWGITGNPPLTSLVFLGEPKAIAQARAAIRKAKGEA